MKNNASVGFTLQKIICDKFNIVPESQHALKQFEASYNCDLKEQLDNVSDKVFKKLKLKPVKCTTLSKGLDNKNITYNFVLSDNSTLSIRTNVNGSKVAPREVGQAGFKKLNDNFATIYGSTIETQQDIKQLMIKHIDEVLPIFINHLFDADHIVWLYIDNTNKYNFYLIDGDADTNIDFDRNKFSFTRGLDSWIESTTLKYEGKSIAEIQTHSKRTFKFRFIMNKFVDLLINKKINNETLGMTLEKTICDKFNLECPDSFKTRCDLSLEGQLKNAVNDAFSKLPRAIKHTGSLKGERGENSKCSYDFILYGNKTLSVKSNIGMMVCPPEVGQPGSKTAYLYFKDFIPETYVDRDNFKKMVYEHIDEIMPIYVQHMFDSDYLLWIFNKNKKFNYKIIERNYAKNFKWEKEKFSFTKTSAEKWNESNTIKYNGKSIGEFQVHKHRDCFKFRFNLKNFIDVVSEQI